MGAVIRFRGLLVTSKYSCVIQIRSFGRQNVYFSLHDRKRREKMLAIPNVNKLWTRYSAIKITEDNFKKFLLSELIDECQLTELNLPLHHVEKTLIIKSTIDTLMKCNLVQSVSSVVNALLSQLERFPFDTTNIEQHGKDLSIKHIRNEIEKQYLAYKYGIDLEDIEGILHRYRLCLYEFRSLGNLQRNIDKLGKLPNTSDLCVS